MHHCTIDYSAPYFPCDLLCDHVKLIVFGCRNKKALLIPRKLSPQLTVPANIGKPPYADSGVFPPWAENPQFHDAEVWILLAHCSSIQ